MNRRAWFAAALAIPAAASAQATFGKTIILKAVKESFTLDGKTSTFTLSYSPQSNQAFLLFYDNVVMCEGVDYTLVGKTLTVPPIVGVPVASTQTTFPLAANDHLWGQYWAEFSA